MTVFEKQNADIVVGSKWHPESEVDYSLSRRLLSWGYLYLVTLLFKIGVSDTQAGIKLFRREVTRKLLPKLQIDGFSFDIEILSLAKNLGFTKIYDAPIKVNLPDDKDSTITFKGFLSTSFRMFIDTIIVYWRHKNKRNWITPPSI
jgi:hypothetical protein